MNHSILPTEEHGNWKPLWDRATQIHTHKFWVLWKEMTLWHKKGSPPIEISRQDKSCAIGCMMSDTHKHYIRLIRTPLKRNQCLWSSSTTTTSQLQPLMVAFTNLKGRQSEMNEQSKLSIHCIWSRILFVFT